MGWASLGHQPCRKQLGPCRGPIAWVLLQRRGDAFLTHIFPLVQELKFCQRTCTSLVRHENWPLASVPSTPPSRETRLGAGVPECQTVPQ